jgi:hypothetical protein
MPQGPASSVVDEALELFGAARVAQFAQRLGLDLPDAFARDFEVLADFFEGVWGCPPWCTSDCGGACSVAPARAPAPTPHVTALAYARANMGPQPVLTPFRGAPRGRGAVAVNDLMSTRQRTFQPRWGRAAQHKVSVVHYGHESRSWWRRTRFAGSRGPRVPMGPKTLGPRVLTAARRQPTWGMTGGRQTVWREPSLCSGFAYAD